MRDGDLAADAQGRVGRKSQREMTHCEVSPAAGLSLPQNASDGRNEALVDSSG